MIATPQSFDPFSLEIPPASALAMVPREKTPKPRKKTVRGLIPAELPLERIVAVIDTREQLPQDLHPLKMETDTLATGDYSVRGLEPFVTVERKSLADFVACCGVERDRFERCIQRMLAYPCRAIVIEASRQDLDAGAWRSRISASAVVGSFLGWQAGGVPIVLSGTRAAAAQDIAQLLIFAARRRWREARELIVAADRTEEKQRAIKEACECL